MKKEKGFLELKVDYEVRRRLRLLESRIYVQEWLTCAAIIMGLLNVINILVLCVR